MDNLGEYLEKIDNIHKAIRVGNLKELQEILGNQKKFAIARDRKGATPLHDAILYEQTEILRFLAEYFPLSLNSPDYNKRTPLHYAAAARDGGHYYKILSKAGADPKSVDNEGHTAEFYCRNQGILDLKGINLNNQTNNHDTSSLQIGHMIHMFYLKHIIMMSYLINLSSDDEDARSPGLESRSSEDSVPTPMSTTGGITMNGFEPQFNEEEGENAFSTALENKLNQLKQEEFHLPATENGIYLAKGRFENWSSFSD